MNPSFLPGYSVQGFGIPQTAANLFAELADVEVDIIDPSLSHGHALITTPIVVTAEMHRKFNPSIEPPDLHSKHPLSASDMSVVVELEGEFVYKVHLSTDARVIVWMLDPAAAWLRLLMGCMSYDLEPKPSKIVLDNNHTAFDIIGGAGTCHYGDEKC